MAKRKRKTRREKQEKNRQLEHLRKINPGEKKPVAPLSEKPKAVQSQTDTRIRGEVRKSLFFVVSFVILLVIITLLSTRTDLLDPFLELIGFSSLY